jgi:hypothetical protein
MQKHKGTKRLAIEARSATRRARAIELRKKGLTYRQIAEVMRRPGPNGEPPEAPRGYGEANAYRDIQAELAHLAQERRDDAEAVRALELARLDRLLLALEKGIASGDVQSINAAIRLSESRRKLEGVDAPTKIAPTTPDGQKTAGGVLMVPNPLTPEQWEECVAQEQAALLRRQGGD